MKVKNVECGILNAELNQPIQNSEFKIQNSPHSEFKIQNSELKDRTIFRKTPFKGLISELAKKAGVSHTRVGKSFWSPTTPAEFAIKKQVIEEMAKRLAEYKSGIKNDKISAENDELNKEVQKLLEKL
jgi:hypothetical protein